jgi:hypothetical protein
MQISRKREKVKRTKINALTMRCRAQEWPLCVQIDCGGSEAKSSSGSSYSVHVHGKHGRHMMTV